MRCVRNKRERIIWEFVIVKNKLMSVSVHSKCGAKIKFLLYCLKVNTVFIAVTLVVL